jgi:hypothetical protein
MSDTLPEHHGDSMSTPSDSDITREVLTLLALPAELRNHIWNYALPSEPQTFRFTYSLYQPAPAVLHVNRQIRSDALGLYYTDREFNFCVHHRNTHQLIAWLSHLDTPARKALLLYPKVIIIRYFDAHHKDYDSIR